MITLSTLCILTFIIQSTRIYKFYQQLDKKEDFIFEVGTFNFVILWCSGIATLTIIITFMQNYLP